ncbi:MAG: ABC transporter transmembrane domain-containing protein [Paracoccaceae bacterium]
MDTKLFAFVWRHSRAQQLTILALTIATFPLVYASLEIPKIIINQAINGTDFPISIFGIDFDQVPYLLFLCFVFLGLVVAINGLKWLINVSIGMCGERMLRRLRFMLFEHLMRFRMRRFRGTRAGDVIQAMLGEVEPLGGFIGEVIATPIFQGGLLLVYVGFIFAQDPLLGAAAIAFYPIQAWLIPKLQRKVIRLNKDRARNTRRLADTIGESVGTISDIRTNGTALWHLAQISGKLFSNTRIRLELFKRKFTIKFINNFINQLTPFFFYSIGGYLVIKGDLDFGALVAVLAAYKDLAGPWKALLTYVQRWADFNSRFTYVVESFQGEDVAPPEMLTRAGEPLGPPLRLEEIEGGPGSGGLAVRRLEVAPGETLAIVGGLTGARETAIRIMAGLAEPAGGTVTLGATPLGDATLPQLGASICYVGQEPGLVSGTIRENLLYGLFRQPPDLKAAGGEETAIFLREARATGNLTADPEGDWVDYAAAGVADTAALEARLLSLIDAVGLADDLYSAALSSHLDEAEAARWTDPILRTRARLGPQSEELADLLEPWDRGRYNRNGTVLANLFFGLPTKTAGDVSEHLSIPVVEKLLEASKGKALLLEIGWEIGREFAVLVDAVGESSGVLDSVAGYSRTEIQEAAALVAAVHPRGLDALDSRGKGRLRKLAAKFVPVRDQLDVLTPEREAQIIATREVVRPIVSTLDDFVAFDEDRFNPARTVAENILHARRRFDRRSAWRRLDEYLERAIDAEGLRLDLIALGLRVPLNVGDLSAVGRRRLALVRGLVKRPRALLLDGIAGADTPGDRALRVQLRAELPAEAIMVYAAASPEAREGATRLAEVDDAGVLRAVT